MTKRRATTTMTKRRSEGDNENDMEEDDVDIQDVENDDDEDMDADERIQNTTTTTTTTGSATAENAPRIKFAPVDPNKPKTVSTDNTLYRRVRVPQHRLTPLRNHWEEILSLLIENLSLQIRYNTKNRCVELKSANTSAAATNIQKAADFLEAFMMGFEVADAVALLRVEDIYVDSFMVDDVKMLQRDHLSRAVGRIVGQDGKTRFAIENATKTRIVIADTRVYLMGSYTNIKLAKDALCSLIIGAPPGKVYNQMRNVAKRLSERY